MPNDNTVNLSKASDYIKSVLSYENPDVTGEESIDYVNTPVRLTLHQLNNDSDNEIPLFDSRILTREIKIKDFHGDFQTINYNQNLSAPLEINLPSTISNEATNTIIAQQGQRLLYSDGNLTEVEDISTEETETYYTCLIKESDFKIEDNNALSFFRKEGSTVGQYSLAWGGNTREAIAEGAYSFAFGPDSVAKDSTGSSSGFSNIAFGNGARALGKNNSIAIGNQTIAASLDESAAAGQSLAMGFKAAALGNFSTCIGLGEQLKYHVLTTRQNPANQMDTFIYLQETNDLDEPITTLPSSITNYKIAFSSQRNWQVEIKEAGIDDLGFYIRVYLEHQFVPLPESRSEIILLTNSVVGANSTAIGANNTVASSDSIAIGSKIQAIGINSIGIGVGSLTDNFKIGFNSISIGKFNEANLTSNNILIGSYLQSKWDNQIILGRYNAIPSDDDRFIIADGTERTRKNLLTVSNRGYTSIGYGELNTYYEVKGALRTTVNNSSVTPITIGLGTGENYMGLYYGVSLDGSDNTPSTWANKGWILQFNPKNGTLINNVPRGLVSFGPRDVQVDNNLTVNKNITFGKEFPSLENPNGQFINYGSTSLWQEIILNGDTYFNGTLHFPAISQNDDLVTLSPGFYAAHKDNLNLPNEIATLIADNSYVFIIASPYSQPNTTEMILIFHQNGILIGKSDATYISWEKISSEAIT